MSMYRQKLTFLFLLIPRNVMKGDGSSVIRRHLTDKSNVELINSLRTNFVTASQRRVINGASANSPATATTTNSSTLQNGSASGKRDYSSWTTVQDGTMYIPAIDFGQSRLTEERSQYDITVKLFYLPGIPVSRRCAHTRQAIDLVLKELHIDSIDLLVVSFPGVSFDSDDDGEEEEEEEEEKEKDKEIIDNSSNNNDNNNNVKEEDIDCFDSIIQTWRTLENLQEKGMIAQLGVAEFSNDKLAKLLPHTKVKPSVDQINLKDCCVVPKSLILYAKQENIQLLTHNDCTNILPVGTTRELLGPGEKGAGILASAPDADDGIKGHVEPQWVVKYTAVIKDRGVVENKGYFALADIGNCVEQLS